MSSASSADAVRGLQLAVDQSPDVSHPAGEEGGDHLGGIDVDVAEIDIETADGGMAALVDAGAEALVVFDAGGSTDAVIDAAKARGTVVIVATPGIATARSEALVLQALAAENLDAGYQSFASAYAEAHGVAPSERAALGYDAGKLLDELFSALGERLRPGPELALAAERAVLVSSTVRVADGAVGDTASASPGRGAVAGAVVAAVALGTGLLLLRRRHGTRRTSR